MQIHENKQTKLDAQNSILIQCCAGMHKDFKRVSQTEQIL